MQIVLNSSAKASTKSRQYRGLVMTSEPNIVVLHLAIGGAKLHKDNIESRDICRINDANIRN